MRRKVNQFTDEFKFMVIQEYLNTDISRKELQEKHGFRGNSAVSDWMRKFGGNKVTDEQISIQKTMSKEVDKTPQERKLEAKIKELEKALEQERLRTLALNTMINIAERDLKISIRKKSGTKQ
ncbi:MAG: transposase [Bacteroidales bacterium]|jgi:transposase|nr:transposase [Bacteroidales bacterium]